jgi:hypothetical protein
MYTFTRPSYSSHTTSSIVRDRSTVSKMGPTIAMGLLKLRVLRKTPLVGTAPPRVNRARDKATQMVTSSWHTRGPSEEIRHPQDLYLSPSREVSFMPLRAGWHLAVRVFFARYYPRKLLETTWPGFDLRGGALAPVWSYGETLFLPSSHP